MSLSARGHPDSADSAMAARNPDRWRLHQLLAHEDRIALAQKEMQRSMAASQPTAPDGEPEPGAHHRMATLLP